MTERREVGRALRKIVPRSLHARWTPPADRSDPVDMLIEAGRHRIGSLLPIRHERMRASPFAFYRGAGMIMAADLASTPSTGLWVQACGDCHMGNFGTFASPEGAPIFDINDFDETHPAPFEWDVKRLATSFAVNALSRRLDTCAARTLARTVVMAYRLHMQALGRLDPLLLWQSRIEVRDLLPGIDDPRMRERECRRLLTATEASRAGYRKLIERSKGRWRIKPQPPLIIPISGQSDNTHERVARTAFDAYRTNLPEERRILLNRYDLHDVAFKVVGIGSVGTFCALGLFATPDNDTLLLQLKEAQDSTLAPFTGPGAYANPAQRVVVGQRILQALPDMFLGWTDDPRDDQRCYVRRFKDSRLALIGSDLAEGALPYYATLCGLTLARAHARSSDPARMAGYMGSGGSFDAAVASFAVAYAAQTEVDWRLFLDAIQAGAIQAGGG